MAAGARTARRDRCDRTVGAFVGSYLLSVMFRDASGDWVSQKQAITDLGAFITTALACVCMAIPLRAQLSERREA